MTMPHGGVREQIAAACRGLSASGLVKGTAGNVSVRVDGGIAITATGLVFAEATVDDVVIVDDKGKVVVGALAPSSELGLHAAAYQEDAVRSVVHTHAPGSIAVSLVSDRLPCIHYQQLALGGEVAVIPYFLFGSPELAEHASATLSEANAVILAHHGAVTTGGTLDEAIGNTSLLEWACDIYLRARSIDTPSELSSEQQAEVIMSVVATGYGTKRRAE
ncbi:class II aldolase/adducin family protein [Mycetocola reblochoni]|uniref:class II aldolase/adducin family protein n=2 Tax=Microbacteriaceae TaxID=85023 RepID=UPI003F9EA76F